MHTNSIETQLQELGLCEHMKVWWNSSRARKGYSGVVQTYATCMRFFARLFMKLIQSSSINSMQGLVSFHWVEDIMLMNFQSFMGSEVHYIPY